MHIGLLGLSCDSTGWSAWRIGTTWRIRYPWG